MTSTTSCEQRCGQPAAVYAIDPCPGGWGGRYCRVCASALGFQTVDVLDDNQVAARDLRPGDVLAGSVGARDRTVEKVGHGHGSVVLQTRPGWGRPVLQPDQMVRIRERTL